MKGLRLVVALALAPTLLPACNKKDEPVTANPSSSASTALPAGATAVLPTPSNSATLGPMQPMRDPEWALDPADPAEDYVNRYVRAVKRYGERTSCIEVQKSRFKDEQSVVDVKNDASGTCGPAGQLRDTFLVNVGANRMTLAGSSHQALAKWPDNSDPGAPPGPITSVEDLRAWKAPLKQAFKDLLLVPLRVQLYGRGTYPVVSIAGWHGQVLRTSTPEQLAPVAKQICEANGGLPLGIIAGLDRVTLLRLECPDKARWEILR
jgi:hypothetical protein